MNLEPILATIGSAIVLNEVITPVQALGGAVMIAALVAFPLEVKQCHRDGTIAVTPKTRRVV